jgi:hypothetical protein
VAPPLFLLLDKPPLWHRPPPRAKAVPPPSPPHHQPVAAPSSPPDHLYSHRDKSPQQPSTLTLNAAATVGVNPPPGATATLPPLCTIAHTAPGSATTSLLWQTPSPLRRRPLSSVTLNLWSRGVGLLESDEEGGHDPWIDSPF